MAVEFGRNYVLEEFRLEPEKRVLSRDGVQVRLANRPFQVLVYLIENYDRLVRRDELLERFWDGRDVYDEALTKCVGAIRKALKEPHENPRFIETRWAEGYRFIGNFEEQSAPSFVEIERTREIKFVLEESNGNGRKPAAIAGELTGNDRPFRSGIRVIMPATVTFVLVLAAGAVFLAYQFTGPTTQTVLTNPAPINSIAVLPFKNLTNKPEREIFTDGMTESLIGSLSKIEDLKVISRNSVFAFKGKDADPREVGRQLNVAAILEGSVREDGERIRVEARLVNAETREIIWSSDSYDRSRGDLFEIQDDIARSVAARLRIQLTSDAEQRMTTRHTNNLEAYQAYVKGRHFWKQKTPEGLEKSRQFFDEAIRLDPNYALAYAGLVDYHVSGIWYANFPPQTAHENAKLAAARIFEINDSLPESHSARARLAGAEWDWETHRKEIERTLELNPNDAHYWQGYAFYLNNNAGRADEAVTAMKRAVELDPLSPNINTDVGVMLNHAGRYDEAIEVFRKTLEIDSRFNDAYYNLGIAYERKKLMREAVDAYITSWRLKGEREDRLAALQTAFEQSGVAGFWRKRLELLERDAQNKAISPFFLAQYQARLGEKDAAFQNLEKSYAAREPYLIALKSSFSFESLRDDPRFFDLARRVGLAK